MSRGSAFQLGSVNHNTSCRAGRCRKINQANASLEELGKSTKLRYNLMLEQVQYHSIITLISPPKYQIPITR
jgi:hypothetical protein